MKTFKDEKCLIKLIETKEEMEAALRLYSRIAVKKNPLIIDLNISDEFYYENYCKYWLDFLLKENLSIGAFDLETQKLICVSLSMDLFSEPPKELDLENLHPLMQREEAVCLKGLQEYIDEGIIVKKKGYYFYELMAATEEKNSQNKIYYKVSIYRISLMLKKGFILYYGELTTPMGIRAWIEKIKPTYIKKISLNDFEFKGKKVFANVDWKKMGLEDEKAYVYCIIKKFSINDSPKL